MGTWWEIGKRDELKKLKCTPLPNIWYYQNFQLQNLEKNSSEWKSEVCYKSISVIHSSDCHEHNSIRKHFEHCSACTSRAAVIHVSFYVNQ